MGSVEELCDHITLINKSKTILEGQVKDVKQQFKSNVYEFSFLGDHEQLEEQLTNFEIIERELSSDGTRGFKVKILNGLSENDLISAVISKVHMKSFREIIPNMDEIFIRAVKESVN
jgi:ABC-2 type transport system ATP-binding protein